MERFTTNNTNTDPFIRNNQDTNPAKFGHINAIVDAVTALQNIPPGTATLQTASDAGGFNNGSTLREGSYDFGGQGGISRICSVGYEDMWQAGIHHIFDSNGFIRESNNCFNIIPDNTFDDTLRFKQGSRWVLDDGTTYVCYDATTGAAVWIPNSGSFTPAISDEVDCDVTVLKGIYSRVDNVVTMTLYLSIELDTAGTNGTFNLALPVASTFATARDCFGTATIMNNPIDQMTYYIISADTANNKCAVEVQGNTGVTSVTDFIATIQYLVL